MAITVINMPGALIRCTHGHHGLACAKALLKHGWQTWQEHHSDTMQARPAPAGACKGTAGLDLNMPGKHARSKHQCDTMQVRPAPARASKGIAGLDLNMLGKHAGRTDTMHTRPPRAPMCKGIAETWLTNMAGAPIGYDASAARTGSCKHRHCWAWPKHAR